MIRSSRPLSVVLAVLLVVSSALVGVQPAAGAGSSGDVFTDAVSDQRAWGGGWQPSDDVVQYGSAGNPGWVVEYSEGHAGDLEAWADAGYGTIRAYDNSSNVLVVSAPPKHVGFSWSATYLRSTLREQSYVERIGVNREVEIDPIPSSQLESKSAWSKPKGATLATWGGLNGNFDADGAAWSDEVNTSSLADVRETIGADQIASSADGSGVRVAVLDTGLDYNKTLYGSRVVAGYNALTGEELNTSKTAENRSYEKVHDGADSKHGSWVTTAIAGNGPGPNGTGVAPAAEIVAVKTLGDDGSGSTQQIADGLEYACAEANADVISMSLGSPLPSMQIESKIQTCLEEHDVSAVIVAGGNNRLTTRYVQSPGDSELEGVTTVAATDAKALTESESAYFSAVGPDPETAASPDVAAPGMEITARVGDSSRTLSGTSMATPVVSGVAALAIQEHANLRGQPVELKAHLESTAEPLYRAGTTEVGEGRISAANAVQDVVSDESQEQTRSTEATARDQGNRALSGSYWRPG